MHHQIIRIAAVRQATGLSKSTLYRLIAAGDFPSAVHLSPRCRGWSGSDVQSWIDARFPATIGEGSRNAGL